MADGEKDAQLDDDAHRCLRLRRGIRPFVCVHEAQEAKGEKAWRT